MKAHCRRYAAIFRETGRTALDRAAGARALARAQGHDLSLVVPAARVLLAERDGDIDAGTAGACGEAVRALPGLSSEGSSEESTTATQPAANGIASRGAASRGAASGGAASGGLLRFNDAYGFTRPVYHPLIVTLALAAARRLAEAHPAHAIASEALSDAARGVTDAVPRPGAGEGFALAIWQRVVATRAAALPDEAADATSHHTTIDAHRAGEGCLKKQAIDETIDAWTYRELVGIHGLLHAAIDGPTDAPGASRDGVRAPDAALLARLASACDYHQQHTQPDYTTYQPWGIAAFAMRSETAWFAEQQLHDTTTQMHVEGGGAGLVPGLLLADAAWQLERLAGSGVNVQGQVEAGR